MAETDAERIQLVFGHLARILRRYGCDSTDVLSTRVYVTEMAKTRPLINDAYREFFGPHLPTRTIVEVQGLNEDDSVEIEAVAGCVGRASEPALGPTG